MKKIYTFWVLLGALVLVDIPMARADLLITPLRAVFQDRDRSVIVTLINTSEKTNTYRVGWKLLRMNDNGRYEEVESFTDEQGNNLSAAEMVRFSPRQVTIDPQGRQRVRLSLRRPGELPTGEYRAHLTFTRLAKMPSVTGDENTRGQQMMLHANVAFSIPVVVRSGHANPSVTLKNPRLERPPENAGDQRVRLKVDVVSDSKFSTYGRMKAFWRQPNGKEMEVGLLNNIAVFPEVTDRTVGIPLSEDRFAGGTVRVVYEGLDEYAGTIFDEKVFDIR